MEQRICTDIFNEVRTILNLLLHDIKVKNKMTSNSGRKWNNNVAVNIIIPLSPPIISINAQDSVLYAPYI